jgi:signal transduction histidine kinase
VTALLCLVIAPLVVALFAAGVNAAVYAHRRGELAHRWLALACLGCGALVAATGLFFTAETRDQALHARLALSFFAAPGALAIARFWSHRFGASLGRGESLGVASILLWSALGLVPGVVYESGSATRELGAFGVRYVDVLPTTLGALAPLGVVPLGALLCWRTARLAKPLADRRMVLGLTAAGLLALASDMLVLGAWLDAPLVFASTFTAVGVVLTGHMLRRFVASMEHVEASAGELQSAAEARAEQLRHADLELARGARLAALGTLAAGLAHEINNPVAFIRSNLNYLEELASEEHGDAEIAEVLAETEEGVARVRGIVAELLRMASHGETRLGPVDLGEVVESALPTLRYEARGDVRLETRLEPMPRLHGDRNLLGQVVANLVVNAIQALRGAGATGTVRIETRADERCAVLEVSDDGPGVPPELAGRIFEPFFTTKPAGQGTGLGLAVTRQLVERLGGRIALVPTQRGARFRVELPLLDAARPPRLASGVVSPLPGASAQPENFRSGHHG